MWTAFPSFVRLSHYLLRAIRGNRAAHRQVRMKRIFSAWAKSPVFNAACTSLIVLLPGQDPGKGSSYWERREHWTIPPRKQTILPHARDPLPSLVNLDCERPGRKYGDVGLRVVLNAQDSDAIEGAIAALDRERKSPRRKCLVPRMGFGSCKHKIQNKSAPIGIIDMNLSPLIAKKDLNARMQDRRCSPSGFDLGREPYRIFKTDVLGDVHRGFATAGAGFPPVVSCSEWAASPVNRFHAAYVLIASISPFASYSFGLGMARPPVCATQRKFSRATSLMR